MEDAYGPYPDCMMPDGAQPCEAFARLLQKNKELRNLIEWLWDRGLVAPVHDRGCPEDDTCTCETASRINEALR